jgi:hypothetical protein
MERLRVRPKVAAEQDGRHKDDPVPNTIHYDVADNRIDIVLDEGKTSSLWWATRTSGSA